MRTTTPSRLSRRTFGKGLAAAAAIPGLVPGTTARRAAAQEATNVTFWQFSTEPFVIAAYEEAIAAFQEQNPDVTVTMEIVPWAEQQQKLITGLTTGQLPDVSMLGNNVVAQFQALGALEPLTPYFAQWSEEIGRDITEDIWPGDELYYFLEGDWWGSPVAEETRCLYYRADLLEAAGIDAPPSTWEETREVARQLTTGDVYGFGIPGGIDYATIQTFMSVYLGYGARMLNEEGRCGFDSPEFREALTYYTNLYTEDQVSPPDTPTYGNPQLLELFQQGRLAMMIHNPVLYRSLQEAEVDFFDAVGIAVVPEGPAGRFGFLGGWPLVMWKNAQNKDAAFAWIRFATDPEGYLPQLAAASGLLPGRRSLVDTEPWNTEPLDVFAEQLEFAYPYQYPDPEIPQMGALEVDAVQTAVQSVMLGQATVDDATVALCQRIDEALSR
jgi:ABC-type glycerol-3-phosphate transport system substrate-binding protein